jgi:ribose transport system ATP-binding protein
MDQPLLQFRHVEKRFFASHVLKDVCFSLAAGRVLGLVGENGAGKSTLINILGGILPADSGEILLRGSPLALETPDQAASAGIALVHQELSLFTNLSIAENLFLSDFPQRRVLGLPWIRRGELRRQTAELLGRLGLSLDPGTVVGMLSPGQRQLVEIAKALRGTPQIIVFDEPTTSLSKPETERLFEIVGRLRAEGVSIIYISHNLGDVLRLCDDIVVLRDGEVQAVRPKEEFTIEQMIALMVGRSLQTMFPQRDCRRSPEKVLEVRNLSQPGVVENISFALHRGQLLGISGLMGSGRTELARILFGLDPLRQGQILVRGAPLAHPAPRKCIRRGVAFLTEDRRGEGLLMEASVEDNMVLVSLAQFAAKPLGLIRRRPMRARAKELADSLQIECRSLARQPAKTLSGGNQQKVVLAKWLLGRADVFILDEPTRGVDVGAKYEIYRQISDLASRGAGVLLISSELEELVGLCDRILVMANGEIQSVVEREDFDRHEMLRSALGEQRLR